MKKLTISRGDYGSLEATGAPELSQDGEVSWIRVSNGPDEVAECVLLPGDLRRLRDWIDGRLEEIEQASAATTAARIARSGWR